MAGENVPSGVPAKIRNDAQAKAAKPRAIAYDLGVEGARGLVLRVYPSGVKAWLWRARTGDGRSERMTLAEYRSGPKHSADDLRMSLAEATERAAVLRSMKREHGSVRAVMQQREDEQQAQEAAKEAEAARAADTVAVLVEDYLRVVADEKNVNGPRGARYIRSWREVQRALYRYLLDRDDAGKCHSAVAHKPAPDLTDDDLRLILTKLPSVQANRLRAYVSALYTWGRKQKRVQSNPTELIDKNTERPRQRVLEDAELRKLLADLPESGLTDVHQDFLRFLLLTGLRYGEAANLRTDKLDAKEGIITIGRTKNEQPHVVVLSKQAMEIVKRRKGPEWIFCSATDPEKPLGKYELHAPLRDAIAEKKIRTLPFVPHDLRRSLRTGLARLGCSDAVAEAAIGHQQGGVLAVYNLHKYRGELREWLQKWADHLDSLIAQPKRKRAAA